MSTSTPSKRFSRLAILAGSVGGATVLLGMAQLGSRVLGLLRDRLLATGIGPGPQLDAYYAAFRVPDFIFNILILGAISAAFIPVFAGYLASGKRREADYVASSVLTMGMLALVTVGALAFVFAPQLMPLVAPGFSGEQLDEVVLLSRIMLLSPIFFGLSGIFGSMLNSHNRFVAYATAPLFYNLGIIAGALLAPHFGIYWLAVGVVTGAFLQMLVQFWAIGKVGFRFRPGIDVRHPGVKRILILMLPATLGVAVTQINLLVETIIASTLNEGSLSQFFLATSLAMLPVGVVGASFATAVFPRLAQAASQKQEALFTEHLIGVIRQILFFVIPCSIAMMVLRAQIVRLIYGAGNFDFQDTRYVTTLLGILAVSLFAQALIPLLTRGFYALRNIKTPVLISILSMVINISLAVLLVFVTDNGVAGLAIAFSVASIVQVALLFFFLSAKVPALEDAAMISAVSRIIAASLAMGAAMYGTLYGIAFLAESLQNSYTVLYFALQTLGAAGVGGAVYLITARLLRVPEASRWLSPRRWRNLAG